MMFIEVTHFNGMILLINFEHISTIYAHTEDDGCDIRLSNGRLYILQDTYKEMLDKIEFVCSKKVMRNEDD